MEATGVECRALALGLLSACVVALLAPGTASAGPGGLKYVSDYATSPGGAQGYASAMCPAGRHPLGGGVQSGGGFDQVHVVGTSPVGKGGDPDALADGWGVKVDNLTGFGGTPFAVRSTAICAKGYVHYKSTGALGVAPGEARSVSLGGGCGGPTLHITGGGVSTSAGFADAHVVRMYPYPSGAWGATVHNINAYEEHMYVNAICAPQGSALHLQGRAPSARSSRRACRRGARRTHTWSAVEAP